jgi:imidazolonepropionase-like amidohydrolase
MRWFIALALIIGGLLSGSQLNAQGQPLVIEGGTLIDGTGSIPIRNPVIVIEGNRIKAIGVKGEVTIPPNAKVINADGRTILPGFIDTQAQGDWDYAPPLYLYFGITTVYEGGNQYMAKEKEAQEKGVMKGPRMFLTAGGIQGPVENLRPDQRERAKPWPQGMSVRTPEEAKAGVDKLIAASAPWHGEVIGVGEGITPELLRAVADEAHAHGLVVAGHSEFAAMTCLNGQDITDHMAGVIRSAITNPEYISQIQRLKLEHWPLYYPTPLGVYAYMMEPTSYDSLIEKMVFSHQFLAPTIAHTWNTWGTQIPHSKQYETEVIEFSKTPGLEFVPKDRRDLWAHAYDTTKRVTGRWPVGDQFDATHPLDMQGYAKIDQFLQMFVAAGGKLAGGGDNSNGNVPAFATHQELEQLVYSGLSPMDAILSVTKWAAEAHHHENELGTIEVGKLADIITVNGDPLKDIHVTRNVDTVVLDGKVIDRTLDPNWKNPIPKPPGGNEGFVVPTFN